ncbi:MAG: ABC transporter permease [Verrucomicrobia bacterium]|nr:ABC transporter permease [Verrucomicrobiota bacterium]
MNNLRLAFRNLAKQPVFTAIVIITFALGIGANTAVFSVLNAIVLRPLPFQQPQKLVDLSMYDTREGLGSAEGSSVSYPDFHDWRAQNSVFEGMAVYANQGLTLTEETQATHVIGEAVSAELLDLLRVKPLLGRTFSAKEDEPGNRSVILGCSFWQNHFAGDRAIVGKPVTLDGKSFEVIGVMPSGFNFPLGRDNFGTDVYTSVAVLREAADGKPMTEQRTNHFLGCVARLKNGVSLEQAQANMSTISARLAQQYPDADAHTGVYVRSLRHAIVSQTHSALMMLSAMAACVLLVACVNVANLLLARSVSRQKEISIRAALGAGRRHIVQQLLTESALLGALGGAAGLLLAIWGLDTIKGFLPANIPRVSQISPDLHVLTFTAAASLLVGIAAGLLPAWRASHPNIAGALNESTRGSSEGAHARRLRSVLVVVEIVLALVLLSSAGLLVESFLRLQKVPPGFDRSNVLTARVVLPDTTYAKPEQVAAFYDKLLKRVSQLPGVQSASAAWWIPLSGSEITFTTDIQEHPLPKSEQPAIQTNIVEPYFFQTLRARLLRGREFDERDTRNAPPVAIVTESFAKKYFPGEDAIGKRITSDGSDSAGEPPVREIIGVIGDLHLTSLRESAQPQVYIPHSQFAIPMMSLFVRSTVNPSSLTTSLRNVVAELDKDVPVYRPRPLAEYVSSSIAQPRFNAILVALFAAIALLLAAAGIFGVMSYAVTQRTHEIGIRLALGAQRRDVLRLIFGEGMRLVAIGSVLGILAVFIVSRLLASMLFGIGATDLPTIISVTIVLALSAFLACWWPARRASSVDPVIALRSE